MKRLRIISGVDPRGGGPIEGIRQQAPHYAGAGIEEHILSLDPPDAPWVKNFPLKIFACGLPSASSGGWFKRLPWRRYGFSPHFVPWLRDNVHNYDLVIVHGLWNYATMGARRVLVRCDVPYVVFSHGMLDPWFKRTYPLKSAIKQVFWWFNEGPLLNNARYVLFTSEEEKILAHRSFLPWRVNERVIGYGTADPLQSPDNDLVAQQEAFRKLVPNLKRPYLLYLSRIHPKKGCDLLIDAFAKLCSYGGELDLVVAGPSSPELLENLKSQARSHGIADRIHWPGMLQGEAKWGSFHDAVAFVLPSHQENFGIVVAEAMACGLPVLITNKVNIWREVLGCGGGVVENDDARGIQRLLEGFLALSQAERDAMGKRARAGFIEHFEVGKACQTINAACNDAAGFAIRI